MKHYIIFLAVSMMMMIGCSKSDINNDKKDDCNDFFKFSDKMGKEEEKVMDANKTYNLDTTSENCEKYKTALKTYINVLEKNEKCAVSSGAIKQWEQELQGTKNSLNELQCQ